MPDPVLVVAADLHFAKILERACNAQGLESISADEGETALVALEFEKPIAVILENDLRDRTGIDLAKEMRTRPEGEALPIILLAGPMMPAAELASKAVKVGVTCCLDASLDPSHIAIGLRALLDGDDSVLGRLVNGLPLEAPAPASAAKPKASTRQSDAAGTRVREDDEPGVKGDAPSEGDAGSGIEVEIDDRVFTSGKMKSPPAKPKHPPAKPRNGSLGSLPFARLLTELHDEHATGALELSREKVKKTIWLSDGVPVAAKSNAMGETLGAVLVKMGKLSESQRAESVERMQKEKKRHGEVLVEMGVVRQKDVNAALQAQARAKVINCFAWDDGSYDFKPADDVPPEQSELKMSFGSLIAAGVKQRYDLPRLRKVLLPHIGETPRFQEEMGAVLGEMKLEESERKVIEGLKGRRSLAEVLALSDMEELDLHRVLVTAFFAGAVQFNAEGQATRQYRMEKEGGKSPSQIAPDKTPAPVKSPERLVAAKTKPSVTKERDPVDDLLREVEGERTNVEDENTPPPVPKAKGAAGKAPKRSAVPADPSREETGPKVEATQPDPESEETRPPDEAAPDPAVVAKVDAALTKMRGQNHYERLAVATDAAAAAIKSAYLRLAKEFHPDRLVQDGGSSIKSKADELFAMISEAYHTLTNETKRRKYDDEVLRGIKDDATEEANAILNAEHQFLKGERLLKAGNIAKAHEAFTEAVELYPKEAEYQACFGWTTFKLNHPADAKKANEGERIVKQALTMNARNDKAHYFLGQIAKTRGNLEEAKKHFEKALEVQPDNIDAQRELRVMDMRDSKKGGSLSGLFGRKK